MSKVIFYSLDIEAVMAGLRRFAAELGARPEVREVVLIGSLAKGTWSARSDADVVILVDWAEGPSAFRGPDYFPDHSSGSHWISSSIRPRNP
jgi:predicted nucleotidyltransferase